MNKGIAKDRVTYQPEHEAPALADLALVPDARDFLTEAEAQPYLAAVGKTVEELPMMFEDPRGGYIGIDVVGSSPRTATVRKLVEQLLLTLVTE